MVGPKNTKWPNDYLQGSKLWKEGVTIAKSPCFTCTECGIEVIDPEVEIFEAIQYQGDRVRELAIEVLAYMQRHEIVHLLQSLSPHNIPKYGWVNVPSG